MIAIGGGDGGATTGGLMIGNALDAAIEGATGIAPGGVVCTGTAGGGGT